MLKDQKPKKVNIQVVILLLVSLFALIAIPNAKNIFREIREEQSEFSNEVATNSVLKEYYNSNNKIVQRYHVNGEVENFYYDTDGELVSNEQNSTRTINTTSPGSTVSSAGIPSFRSAEILDLNWPQYQRYSTHNGANNSSSISLNLEEQWELYPVTSISRQTSPVIFNDTLYIGKHLVSTPGYFTEFFAVDLVTGTTKWTFETGPWLEFTPAVDEDLQNRTVIFFADKPASYGFNAPNTPSYMYAIVDEGGSPSVKWKTPIALEAWSSAVTVGRDHVYTILHDIVGTGNDTRKMYAFNKETGQIAWSVPVNFSDAAPAVNYIPGSPINNQPERICLADNYMRCYNNTGTLLWQHQIYTGPGSQVHNEAKSIPAMVGDSVIVGSRDGSVYSFDLNGNLNWTSDLYSGNDDQIFSSPAIFNDRIFIQADDHSLYSLDLQTGQIIWSHYDRNDSLVNEYSSPSVDSNGKVFAFIPTDAVQGGGFDIALKVFDGLASSDTVLFSEVVSVNGIQSNPVLYKNAVYFSGDDGYVRKWQNPALAPIQLRIDTTIGNEINSFTPSTVFQNDDTSRIGKTGTPSDFSRYYSALDLSNIPASANIVAARYMTVCGPIFLYGDAQLEVREVLSPWNPSTLNWNNQPNFSSIAQPVYYQQYGLEADITDLVKSTLASGNSRLGLITKFADESPGSQVDYANCYTDDNFSPPRLRVWYR